MLEIGDKLYLVNIMIVIPSLGRYNHMKTLTTLKEHNISNDYIKVYVVPEEFDLYKQMYPEYEIIVGVRGLVAQRQFIMDSYPIGTHLIFMDDDIELIDLSMTSFTLIDFFEHAFKTCRDKNAYIWGVYPVLNPFFREKREEMSTCLNYIVGAFYGIINRRIPLTITTGEKEDVERSIQYFIQDGIVLRFNKVGFKTKYYGKTGGLGTLKERIESSKQKSYELFEKYPGYGKVKTRKNGITEFVLKKLTKVY
jgi:hypothetical protein